MVATRFALPLLIAVACTRASANPEPAPNPLPAAPEPGVRPRDAKPVRAPPGPAVVTTMIPDFDWSEHLAIADGTACWVQKPDSQHGFVYCGPLSGAKPRRIAAVNDPVEIVISAGWVYWLDTPSPKTRGSLRRTRIPDGPVETLASGLDNPSALAVQGSDVYWVETTGGGLVHRLRLGAASGIETLAKIDTQGFASIALTATDAYVGSFDGLVIVPLHGGESRRLAQSQYIGEIALDDTHVFWTTGADRPGVGSVWEAPLGGGPARQLAQHQTYPSGLSTGGGYVYWSDSFALAILRVSAAGGPVELVAGEQFVHGLRLAKRGLVWIAQTISDRSALRTCEIPRRAPPLGVPKEEPKCRENTVGRRCAERIAKGLEAPSGIAVAGDRVFWSDSEAGLIWQAPAAGGEPTMVALGEDRPAELIVARGFLYWGNRGSNALRRWPLAGGAPTTVTQGHGPPHNLVTDGDALYWADGHQNEADGTLFRLDLGTGEIKSLTTMPATWLAVDRNWVYVVVEFGAEVADSEYAQILRLPTRGGEVESVLGYHERADMVPFGPRTYAPGGVPGVKVATRIRPVAFSAHDGVVYWIDQSGDLNQLDLANATVSIIEGPKEPANIPARGGLPAGARVAVGFRTGGIAWASGATGHGKLYWASSYHADLAGGGLFSMAMPGASVEQVAEARASMLAVGDDAVFYLGTDGDVVRVAPR